MKEMTAEDRLPTVALYCSGIVQEESKHGSQVTWATDASCEVGTLFFYYYYLGRILHTNLATVVESSYF